MKFLISLILILFISDQVNGQSAHLQLNNKIVESTKIIEEGKRVEVEILNREKLLGKLSIINDSMISIQDHLLNLSDIKYIKRNPLGLNIVGKVLFIGGGLLLGVVGSWATWLFIGIKSGVSVASVISALVAASGLTITTVGILNLNIFTTKKYQNDWHYKLVTVKQ